MTTKEQYIESFKSGWKLASKLKSKCKGKLTMEVASAGLCLSLAAALTDDDVEEARDAVKKLLLIYWRHNFNKDASDEPVSISITTEVSTNAFALTDTLESECEGQDAAAVMWAGLLLAAETAHIEKGEGEEEIGLGGLLHLLQRATADRSRLTHLFS
jgi:hypothetical protein